MAFGTATYPYHIRRKFQIHISDCPWETDEILLPSELARNQIWEHRQTVRTLPDIRQFVICSGKSDISKSDKWPGETIVAIPHKVTVTWQVEIQAGGHEIIIQENMTPLVSV
jgi:hypothetical protein